MEDLQLLREYAEHRSERAFTELVHRHIDFVYSTALRLVPENQLAEDVTQLVFIKLARKAGSLREGTVLTGWLYRTTQFIAQTAQRSDWRRRKRENLAMQFTELNAESESAWKEVAPLLEPAMANLRKADQDAVLLRFFAGKSLREVGDALGVSDDAAQKRVDRALEKMRDYFAASGVTVSVGVITSAIAAHAVQTAPIDLASNLAASMAGATSVGATTLKVLAVAKLKTALVTVLATAIVLFTGTFVVMRILPVAAPQVVAGAETPAFVVRGKVHTQDGKPLAGALVRVGTPQVSVRLYQITNSPPPTNITSTASNQIAKAPRQAPSTNTAADGSFVIGLSETPKDGMAAIVVNSDAGYALVTADELSVNPDVTVQPWARIEGVLRVGRSIATNETVSMSIWGSGELYDWNLVQHGASTKTDANGRFVFPRVAPVDVWLTHSVMVKSNDWRPSGHHYVKVLPGDQIVVQLGGIGRTVAGRVSWDATGKLPYYGTMWSNQKHNMRWPRNVKQMTIDEKRQYERTWRDSPEGELFKNEVRNYEFPVGADGTFRVPDVLPGSYRLNVRADERAPDGKMRNAAVAEIRIEVPELPPGQTDEPLDVGSLYPNAISHR